MRWTKRALNQWLRMMGPAFDYSLATEMLSFLVPTSEKGCKHYARSGSPIFLQHRIRGSAILLSTSHL